MTDDRDTDELAKKEEREESEAELLPDLEEDEGEGMPGTKTVFRQMMAMFGVGPGGRAYHPVFDKFEPGHVDKFLDHSHTEDMERLRIRKRGPWFVLIYVVLALVAFGWLVTVLLPENTNLLTEFLKVALAFAGGVGSGYGLKSYQESRQRG